MLSAAVLGQYVPSGTEKSVVGTKTVTQQVLRGKGTAMISAAADTCKMVYEPLSALKDSAAYYSHNDQEFFFDYDAMDLGGSKTDGPYKLKPSTFENRSATKDGKSLAGRCTQVTPEGTWHTTRIGPWVSTGGFDWWAMGWRDFLEGVELPLAIDAFYTGSVDTNNKAIGLPPLHIHHMHFGPGHGFLPRMSEIFSCFTQGKDCFSPGNIFYQNGDNQPKEIHGGMDAMGRHFEAVHGATYTYNEIAIDGNFNDVRAAGSPPLVWYYQASLRTVCEGCTGIPAQDKVEKAVSAHFSSSPGVNNGHFMAFPTSRTLDTFFFYTGRMPFAGDLISSEYHCHQLHCQKAFFYAGAPHHTGVDRLSLEPPEFGPQSTETGTTGFADNTALRKYFLDELERSGRAARAQNAVSIPQLICEVTGNVAIVDNGGHNEIFDRMINATCHEWSFDQGVQFTVVSFSGLSKENFGDAAAAQGMVKDDADEKSYWPQHSHPMIYYMSKDGRSHHTFTTYGMKDLATDYVTSGSDLAYSMQEAGTPSHHLTSYPKKRAKVGALFLVLWIATTLIGQVMFVAAIFFCCGRCCKRRKSPPATSTCNSALSDVLLGLGVISFVAWMMIPEAVFLCNKADSDELALRPDRTKGTMPILVLSILCAVLFAALALRPKEDARAARTAKSLELEQKMPLTNV